MPDPQRELVEACLEALKQAAPAKVRAQWRPPAGGPPGAVAAVEVGLAGEPVRYAIEVRKTLAGPLVGPLVNLARQWKEAGTPMLLCTDRVTDKLGEELREEGVAYLDRGGNAHLPGPLLNILILGRQPAKIHRRRQNVKGTEARLLGVFLREPAAGEATQKELAGQAGIALGAVGAAREKLVDLGILDRRGERQWRLRDRELGLQRFAEGWAAVIRHKLEPKTFRMLRPEGRGTLLEQLAAMDPEHGCLLGGELAAAGLTRFLDTEHATLHVPAGKRAAVATDLLLVPDANGNMTMLDRYGTGDQFEPRPRGGAAWIHPLWIWAECLTVPDDRVAQVARMVHDQYLAGADA